MKSLLVTRYSLLTIMALVLLLFGCRSQKTATATTKEVVDVEAAGSFSTSTAERFQWLSRLSLDIDSFELIMPTADHVPDYRNMAADTANGQDKGLYTINNTPYTTSEARIILRGKHARLGRADIVQRDAARHSEQVDTLSAHRSIDKADHYARDNVGIVKPPDVTWWPWLMLAGLLVGCCIVIWLKKKR